MSQYPSNNPTTPPGGRRILVVDDHVDTLGVTVRLLRRSGFETLGVGSMADALDQLGRQSFDLLITDIGLPDGDGWELIRAACRRRPIPAIAMSGFGTDRDLERSRSAGFCRHLTKPVAFADLKSAITECLDAAPADASPPSQSPYL